MDEMAKPFGLNRRGRVWYYRARVPKDLAGLYKEREKWISLGTTDFAEALTQFHIEAARKRAEYDEMRKRRDSLRSLQASPSAEGFIIDREEAAALARAYLSERLSTDESRQTARHYKGGQMLFAWS
ncbi:DUF6538 domain-containing protein [Rhizobium beringeri]|uniref:DUF6538 domain-containing protein n=1 Tax=Rhizobium beringeri TaxID=3019934 RepID=UPI003990AEB5